MADETYQPLTQTEVQKAAHASLRAFSEAGETAEGLLALMPGTEAMRVAAVLDQAIRALEGKIAADEANTGELIRIVSMGVEAAKVVARNRLDAHRAFVEMRATAAKERKERQQTQLRKLLIEQAKLNLEEKAAQLQYRYGRGKGSKEETLRFLQELSAMRAGIDDDDLALLERVSMDAREVFEVADEADETAERPGGVIPDREEDLPAGDLPTEEEPERIPSE